MKCTNPNCGGEWKPPPGKSVTVCPFCQEPVVSEKKTAKSFDRVLDTLVYIKEQYSADMLLSEKVCAYFADLTRNQLRDEKDLIKQLCEKGALDCLKMAIGKPASEHELAIKRALAKLPKYLQDSPTVTDMIFCFVEALEWRITKPQRLQTQNIVQNQSQQPEQSAVFSQRVTSKSNIVIKVAPHVGSVISVADIDWRVLAVENNKALLISEKVLERRKYHSPQGHITWENCTLREYLNNEFYNKLGAAKSAIAETRNSNPNNPWYGTNGGKATTDKVFLLSLDELVKYFGDSGALAQKQGKDIKYYDYSNGSSTPDPNAYWWFGDQYNNVRIANYGGEGAEWWWLRSPGDDSDRAAYVKTAGYVSTIGRFVSLSGGVRPTLWLNL